MAESNCKDCTCGCCVWPFGEVVESCQCAPCLDHRKRNQEQKESDERFQKRKQAEREAIDTRQAAHLSKIHRNDQLDAGNKAGKRAVKRQEIHDKQRHSAQEQRRMDRVDARWVESESSTVDGVQPDWEAFEAARMSIEIDETALTLGAILERTDLRPILYAQKVNYVAARPNGGKSWLSYKTAIQVIQSGGRVIFLDYDNKRPDVLSRRVRDMGYADLFKRDDVYFADIYQWTNPAVRAAAAQWLLAADYPVNSTIIIDTDTSAGAANDGSDIREWWESFITPWNKLEIGMLVLAHLPKREEETHGPMGSQDKRGLLDGASYLLETAIAWNAEQGGVLHLRVDKDRHGQLPAVEGEVAADVVAEWLELDGERVLNITIEPPNEHRKAESIADKLTSILGDNADGVYSQAALFDMLKGGKGRDKSTALKALIDGGEVIAQDVPGKRGKVYMLASLTI